MNRFIPMILALVVFLGSCSQVKEAEENREVTKDHVLAESLFSDVWKIMDQIAMDTDGIRADGCIDHVIVDTLSTPMTLLIDYGVDDCTSDDGQKRKGQIHVSFNGRYGAPGAIVTVVPVGYSVNNYEVSGTKIVENMGENENGNIEFSVTIREGLVTGENGSFSVQWESLRIREWVNGSNTEWITDDHYDIYGTATGVNSEGIAFDVEITSPLRATRTCPYLTKGVVKIIPEGHSVRAVDYGDGQCDSVVEITINGGTYTIVL